MQLGKLKKFEPMSNNANAILADLLKRNGTIITETKTFVEVKRLNSIAKIDQWGRVDWRPA